MNSEKTIPTNDERRDVAEKLRNTLLTEGASQYAIDHDCEEHYAVSEVVFCNLRHLLGFDGTYSVHAVANRIADLIEPEPERTCRMEHVKSGTLYDVWRYTCCGYEHSESRMDAGASKIPDNFCPNCGARVVNR